MKIYDTSLKKNIVFNKKEIKIYVCGPTVYGDVHIGNVRPPIIFDVLNRYLLFKKIKVKYISNITDIDDKIIDQAARKSQHELVLSNNYFEEYLKILKLLKLKLPNLLPKVSDNIDDIINFINLLIEKKIAYQLKDGIYFDTSKVFDYGSISHIKIKENISKNLQSDINKRNSADFVLWKFTTKGITWNFKYGNGRPGWHTECVVLVNKFLGKKIDIHGGGIDLRFPHHENENAQSIAINGISLAKVWMHIGHLMVNENKMAKSLKNFVKAKDLLEKHSANAIKWMFFQVSYSKPFNYFNKLIIDAENSVSKIEHDLNRVKSYLIINKIKLLKAKKLNNDVKQFFENNLNLPKIITYIFNKLKSFPKLINQKKWISLEKNYQQIILILKILGIYFKNSFSKENLKLLKSWKFFFELKDFKKSDAIREKLILKKIL